MRSIDKMFGGVFALAVLVFAVLGCSQFDNVPSQSAIPGTYDAEVTGGEGKGGRFDMIVEQKSTTYALRWATADANFYGRGVFMGNYIGVIFDEEGSDADCGVTFYRTSGPSTINGTTVLLGRDEALPELLFRKSGEGFEGEFSSTAATAGTSPSLTTLTLKKNAGHYNAVWHVDGKTINGTGFAEGNLLAVFHGNSKCRFAVYKNDRGFFESSDVVRFTGRFGNVNGYYSDVKINKRSAVRSGGGE